MAHSSSYLDYLFEALGSYGFQLVKYLFVTIALCKNSLRLLD